MHDGGSETDASRDRNDGPDGEDLQKGDGSPTRRHRRGREGNPWEQPVDHPGKEYEQLAQRYESEGLDDTVPASGSAAGDAPEVSATLQTNFWVLVLVFNLALMGLSVGAMFLVFEGEQTLGSQLFLGGAILFGYGLYRYRKIRRRLDSEELGAENSGE